MEVPEGEICILLGPSGCGKTTTLKMVNRLIEHTSGDIFIDGKNTAEFDTVQLRRTLGYVIQQIGLFPNKTIEDNICIVPDILGWEKKKSRARAAELLELVGARSGDLPEALSEGALRRPAAARRRAARHRRRSAGAAHGRALRRHRPDQPRRHPGRVPEDAGDAQEDDHVRQPRHRRGGEDGRPHRHLPRRAGSSSTTRPTTSSPIRPTASSPISSAATAR